MRIFTKNTSRIIALALLLYVIYVLFSFISDQPFVHDRKASPQQVKSAVKQYTNISRSVFDSKDTIRLRLTQKNIDDVLVAISHMIPRANFNGRMFYSMAVINGTFDIRNRWFDGYLNVSCLLVSGKESGSIDSCLIGNITIPGVLVNGVMNLSLSLFFSDNVRSTINQLINNIHIENQLVTLTATKDSDFKNDFSSGLRSVASAAKKLKSENKEFPEAHVINDYLTFILNSHWPTNTKSLSLGFIVNRAMTRASIRSQNNDPRKENEAALWAIAIAFGNHRFSEIINVNTPEVRQTLAHYPNITTTLHGRWDLALHFLYSAVMERLGDSSMSIHVGELKELYDANSGGTGFDFTDLTADKSGAYFSHYLTSNVDNAMMSQTKLMKSPAERQFIAPITGLPQPIKDKNFNSALGSTQSHRYEELVAIIDQRIRNLPLYNQ